MKIAEVKNYSGAVRSNSNPNNKKSNAQSKNNTPYTSTSFKGMGIAELMQFIEGTGFFGSFLIQDGLGMTAPRTITGFFRDRKQTGEWNIQEGLEVLGREALTGPLMVTVPIALMATTRLFKKTTFTNSNLIKRLGANLKEMISQKNFDKTLLTDPNKKEEFKKAFIRYNFEQIYHNSIPNDKNSKEVVDKIVKDFEGVNDNVNILTKKNTNKTKKAEITKYINDKMLEFSPELDNIDRVKLGDEKSKKSFMTMDVLQAIHDYTDDIIVKNKNLTELDTNKIENTTNNYIAKRFLVNVGNVAAVLGTLSVLPKIYARNDVAPGAKVLLNAKQQNNKENANTNNEVSFKGKGSSKGILTSLGEFISKHVPEKIADLFEYKDFNFAPAMFACLSTLGLLAPRAKRAYDRAIVDENGKRDLSEIKEILTRDTISSLSVVFTAPILAKAIIRNYEDKNGFVLTNRASDGQNIFKRIGAIINPFSSLRAFTSSELNAVYGSALNTNDKMLNFCKYIDDKGGDLYKIISSSENQEKFFNEKTFQLSNLEDLSRKDRNKKITEFFKNIGDNAKKLGLDNHTSKSTQDQIVKELMADSKNIMKKVIDLNAVPSFLATCILSPIILGVLIPLITYSNTRKEHAKMLEQNNNIA